MARHRAPEPATLPRRQPGVWLPADLVPEPRPADEVPPVELLVRIRDGLAAYGGPARR